MAWRILIHTSVKLVTLPVSPNVFTKYILIHTSVKLVTDPLYWDHAFAAYFNPHEREARDVIKTLRMRDDLILIHTSVKLVTRGPIRAEDWRTCYFNPHEREARDYIRERDLRKANHFNPHEREARDSAVCGRLALYSILIHTSVKLVTRGPACTSQTRAF